MSEEEQFSKYVTRIESELQQNPKDLSGVFDELNELRKDNPELFGKNLEGINQQLHEDGFLPGLELVEDGEEMLVAAKSTNPQGSAVIGRSGHPRESEQERSDYRRLHYDGWSDSATGGGGSDGHLNHRAQEGQVPHGRRRQLIDRALELAHVPVTRENEAAVNLIVTNESGWNPNAINRTDSNARAGHPSQGLMQTIPSTFHQYAPAGYNTNINDELSNLAAGIRYAHARYGSLQNVPGVRAVAAGRAYVGY